MDFVAFGPDHAEGVMALCRSEGWSSFANDPDRAQKALLAPGMITIVAVEDGGVVCFAQLQTDGTLQAHLSLIAVAREQRGKRIATRLIEEAFARSDAERIDAISSEGSDGFMSCCHIADFPDTASTRLRAPKKMRWTLKFRQLSGSTSPRVHAQNGTFRLVHKITCA